MDVVRLHIGEQSLYRGLCVAQQHVWSITGRTAKKQGRRVATRPCGTAVTHAARDRGGGGGGGKAEGGGDGGFRANNESISPTRGLLRTEGSPGLHCALAKYGGGGRYSGVS